MFGLRSFIFYQPQVAEYLCLENVLLFSTNRRWQNICVWKTSFYFLPTAGVRIIVFGKRPFIFYQPQVSEYLCLENVLLFSTNRRWQNLCVWKTSFYFLLTAGVRIFVFGKRPFIFYQPQVSEYLCLENVLLFSTNCRWQNICVWKTSFYFLPTAGGRIFVFGKRLFIFYKPQVS